MNNNNLRAAIIATIQSLLPVLQLLGVVHLGGDDIAIIMLFVSNAVTLVFLALKPSSVGTGAALAGAALLIGLVAYGASAKAVSASVDCGAASSNSIRVNIYNTDAPDSNTLISDLGAKVKFQPNPLTGIGSLTVADNGSYDDSATVGRVTIEEACTGDYTLTLSFDADISKCVIADASAKASTVEGNAVVSFEVDDCHAVPTPTPTATNTPTPVPSTPAPTATPIPPTPQVIIIERTVEVPAATATPTIRSIQPPNTGNAGLKTLDRPVLAAWGDDDDGDAGWSLFDTYCPAY